MSINGYILPYQQADSVYSLSPDVTYFCDLDYDPFLVMQDQGKVYGRIRLFVFDQIPINTLDRIHDITT